MSFDKFKKLLPKPVTQPEGTDEYFKELANLEENKPKSKVLPIITTVAAAVLIVAVVSMWAIIGAGIRQNAVIVPATNEYETMNLQMQELTPALNHEIWKLINDNKLDYFPLFSSQNPLTQEKIIYICEQTRNDLFDDLILTKEEYENYVYDTFGIKATIKKDIKYEQRPLVFEYDREGYIITSYSTSDTPEGGLRVCEIGLQFSEVLEKIRWVENSENEFEYVVCITKEEKKYPTPKRDASITNEMRETYFDFIIDYRVDAMPQFLEGETPDTKKMKLFTAHFEPYVCETDNPQKVTQTAKDLFGIENVPIEDMNYVVQLEDLNELPYSELLQYSKEQTENGTVITATVGINRYYDSYVIGRYDDHNYRRKRIAEGNEWMPYFYRICVFKYIAQDDGVTPEKFIEVRHIDNSQGKFSEYFE